MSVAKQRDEALRVANERRLLGADTRRRVIAGEVLVSDIIENPWAHGIPNHLTWNVLLWGPRFGESKLARLNRDAVHGNRNLALPVGKLTERTRRWLVWQLRSKGR